MAGTNGNGYIKKALYTIGVLLLGGMVTFAATSVDKRVTHNEELHSRGASVDSVQNVQISELRTAKREADIDRDLIKENQRQQLNLQMLTLEELGVSKLAIKRALMAPDTADTN